ncbi:16S rRNA (guanine(966)-N(2))-methyltransferase RsmD [Oscillospiraceae bacterium NSJ-54]|uniref:16S rRNA (Guanine(966)-N(2))-methyltransferase RsmD n=2 Tax=Zongyangia hominis TaxID=2763677 RepID=A0A926EE78_9FIRM|nr:16S rRNA (guanine(966)-N(2))-methyltransferase RsmD [Zongyangia hominis]
MRVITGSARGRKLATLEGRDVRPTTDMVKEAMFSILHFEMEQAMVLDLFAGSGQLGIEALSRGARCCIFVDQSTKAQSVIKQNLAATQLSSKARVAAMDAKAFLKTTNETFDVVLLDPPYDSGILPEILPLAAARMSDGGAILCETRLHEELPEECGPFVLKKKYRYGKIALTLYRKREEDGEEE